MKRYGFEQRDVEVRDGINYQTKRVPGYVIFDRLRGISVTIASCNDPADAELLTAALNYFADTQAKRSNHNIEIRSNQVIIPHECANARGGQRCDVCFGELAA